MKLEKTNTEYIAKGLLALLFLIACSVSVQLKAQDEDQEIQEDKPVRSPFESSWIIDNQTPVVYPKGTFEFMIQHRFGEIEHGFQDFFGLWLPSNIRLGFSYTIIENLSIGFGTTKRDEIQDFSAKYAILKQTRSGSMPVDITYYGNVAIETGRKKSLLPNENNSDRLSFFHQVIISRKWSPAFSMMIAPSLSHYNVSTEIDVDGNGFLDSDTNNDHIAIAAAARIKLSSQSSFLINYDQPITDHKAGNPNPNLSFGLEVATSSHAFQIFLGSFDSIIPQKNNVFNNNDPTNGGFVIGFNITRNWNF